MPTLAAKRTSAGVSSLLFGSGSVRNADRPSNGKRNDAIPTTTFSRTWVADDDFFFFAANTQCECLPRGKTKKKKKKTTFLKLKKSRFSHGFVMQERETAVIFLLYIAS
jgi:hypothetical protein